MAGRRWVRAGVAGGVAALAWAAAEAITPGRTVRSLALLGAGSAVLMAAKNTAKVYTVESRLNTHIAATAPAVNFIDNGGTVGGNVTVSGDHHVHGSLYGNGGTLAVGDDIDMNQKNVTNIDVIDGGGSTVTYNDGIYLNGNNVTGAGTYNGANFPGVTTAHATGSGDVVAQLNHVIDRLANQGVQS